MKRLSWISFALLLVAPWAHASDGFVTANVNLRAGPDVDYPWIAIIPAGSRVSIQGCTEGWGWCDVIAFGNRGWMAGDYLRYDDDNRRLLLPAYGARVGIPFVTFVIGDYWSNYYRERPFYRQRSYWYQHPIRHRPPPRYVYHPPAGPRPAQPRPPQQRPPKHWQSPPPSPRPPAPSLRPGQPHAPTLHRQRVGQSIAPASPQRPPRRQPTQASAAQEIHPSPPSNRDDHRPRTAPTANTHHDRAERPSAPGQKAHRNHD